MRIQGMAIFAENSDYRIRRIDPSNNNEPLTDWGNGIIMSEGETMANYEEKSLAEIEEENSAAAQAAEAARLKALCADKLVCKIHEHYTDNEIAIIKSDYQDTKFKTMDGEVHNAADLAAIEAFRAYEEIKMQCRIEAHNEVYNV